MNLSTWQKEFEPFGIYDDEVAQEISKLINNKNFFCETIKEEYREEYKKLLLESLPPTINEISFAASGSEALEHAIVIAQKITKKKYTIAFTGCYHGSSMKMLAFSYPEYSNNTMDENEFIEVCQPHCYRCILNKKDCNNKVCIEKIKNIIEFYKNDVAAILVDPSFGNIVSSPPISFFSKLRDLCTNYKIQLIFDETRTAIGRCGSLFAFNKLKITPDIIVMNKSLACGAPLALTLYNDSTFSSKDKIEMIIRETTFSGNLLTLGISSIVLDNYKKRFNEDKLNKNAQLFKNKLSKLKKYTIIGDIRSFGFIFAIEFVDKNNDYNKSAALLILGKLHREYGISIMPPTYKSVVMLLPYLNISENDMDYVVESFEKVINSTFERKRGYQNGKNK